MELIALLGLLAGAGVLAALGGNDDEPVADDTTDNAPDSPDAPEMADLGTTVAFDPETKTISVDVGADETRQLAAVLIKTDWSSSNCCGQSFNYDLELFLVDDLADLDPANVDDAYLDQFDLEYGIRTVYDDGYLASLQDQLVGEVSLGEFADFGTGSDLVPASGGPDAIERDSVLHDVMIDSNAPLAGGYVMVTDGGYILTDQFAETDLSGPILSHDDTPDDDTTVVVDARQDGSEWRSFYYSNDAYPDGPKNFVGDASDNSLFTLHGSDATGAVHIDARAGNDHVELGDGFVGSVTGGDGNDTISGGGDGFRFEGGSGEDVFLVSGNGQINGGAGSDLFVIETDVRDTLVPVVIEDFSLGEDQLVVPIGDNADGAWTVSILRDTDRDITFVTVRNPEDEAELGTEIGVEIQLLGAPEMSAADIQFAVPAAPA